MSALSDLLLKATARETGPWGRLTQPRYGVMLHYTAGTDLSGLEWLLFDPACKVSYNWLVLDDGTVVSVAPKEARAYHAGVCRPSDHAHDYEDANSAFYGIAIAADDGDRVTVKQLAMVVELIAGLFREHQWPIEHLPFRLTGHQDEAWPRGRKHDPGEVMPVALVRERVAARLLALRTAA